MATDKLNDKQSVAEEAKDVVSGRRTDTVKLTEMGQVSLETKGINRGVELGFTPKT